MFFLLNFSFFFLNNLYCQKVSVGAVRKWLKGIYKLLSFETLYPLFLKQSLFGSFMLEYWFLCINIIYIIYIIRHEVFMFSGNLILQKEIFLVPCKLTSDIPQGWQTWCCNFVYNLGQLLRYVLQQGRTPP